ncbi:MAG: alpha-amylase family glycosyl hydrolase [Nitrospirae bacterium YQR-1]
MPQISIPVKFQYVTGITRRVFENVRLSGSWVTRGRLNQAEYSNDWSKVEMTEVTGTDGCPVFEAVVNFHSSQAGYLFRWGVTVDRITTASSVTGKDLWGITTEVNDINSTEKYRVFTLNATPADGIQTEAYYLTNCRRLGANKYFVAGQSAPLIQFALWAPNARAVEVVFGTVSCGYISDYGVGIDPAAPSIPMVRQRDGVWVTAPVDDFAAYDHKKPYMFRITNRNGRTVYRTDLYSRCQIGSGRTNPRGAPYNGGYRDLDGTTSCSVVVDPEMVVADFQNANSINPSDYVTQEVFWQGDDTNRSNAAFPKRVDDLIIYELHVGALGYGKKDANGNNVAGDIGDAIALLNNNYISDIGVTCVELLPISEFGGVESWGYGTSHYFAVEYSSGGRDQIKHFIRACHSKGMGVLFDVVYNHFAPDGERAQWMYDSGTHEENIYYWFEGRSGDYRKIDGTPFPDGGYIDNMSTGYSPRFYEEMVRKMFISSAVMLMEEFHVDGFRLDQTTSMHSYNVLHADGRPMGNVNAFGAKFLREYCATLKLIKPEVVITAEDHSEWDRVTMPVSAGGLGFDAAWYADFFHNLNGGSGNYTDKARLIKRAGYGNNEPLRIDSFSGALSWAGHNKVVYHESHDEAGNAENSARTIVVAVNYAPLFGETRRYAEGRCKFAVSMAVLSPGTPMFLFGEEVGAENAYKYDNFYMHKEDIVNMRATYGANLYKYYQDLLTLRKTNREALCSRNIDIVHVHNANRVIAFRRWGFIPSRIGENHEYLIVGSLNNSPFDHGYTISNIRSGDGNWREVLNSDAAVYGGHNVGNYSETIRSSGGTITVVIPANGVVVFRKQ